MYSQHLCQFYQSHLGFKYRYLFIPPLLCRFRNNSFLMLQLVMTILVSPSTLVTVYLLIFLLFLLHLFGSCLFTTPFSPVGAFRLYCSGVAFLKAVREGTYDAVIVDSSDPIGKDISEVP